KRLAKVTLVSPCLERPQPRQCPPILPLPTPHASSKRATLPNIGSHSMTLICLLLKTLIETTGAEDSVLSSSVRHRREWGAVTLLSPGRCNPIRSITSGLPAGRQLLREPSGRPPRLTGLTIPMHRYQANQAQVFR